MSDQGWGRPLRERIAHYFVQGVSLCETVYYGGPVEHGRALPGDCRTCANAVRSHAALRKPTGTWVKTLRAATFTPRSQVRH